MELSVDDPHSPIHLIMHDTDMQTLECSVPYRNDADRFPPRAVCYSLAMKYQQSRFDISDEMDLEADAARNAADMTKDALLSRTRGLDAVLRDHQLDAILTPGARGADLAARSGYPIIVVPFGFVENGPPGRFPEGFDAHPAPYGVGFTGAACSEPRLISIAYAFEQATLRRVPPADFR